MLRVYAKVWDKRLREVVHISNRQKAFCPVDGCFENVNILKKLMRRARKKRRKFHVVFIDLAKAIDVVLHDSIRKAMVCKGIPSKIQHTILDHMYAGAYTEVTVGGAKTRRIFIRSGVKQGCPLSPFLFNLIMDELLCKLEGSDLGPTLGGIRVPALAFADDLTVLADNEAEMREILQICEKFFDEKAMSANAKKCQSMKLLPAKGKKVLKAVTEPHR